MGSRFNTCAAIVLRTRKAKVGPAPFCPAGCVDALAACWCNDCLHPVGGCAGGRSGSSSADFGPGLGFTAGAVQGETAASIRFPAELGLELLTSGNGFGFKVLARPWFEVAPTSAADAIGGGLIGLLGFSGYVTE